MRKFLKPTMEKPTMLYVETNGLAYGQTIVDGL